MAERIEIKSLSKNYKSHKVIKNMNVTFPGGKIIGILGPNGSGKSTLIKMLAGVLQPNTGQILIDGEPVGVKSKAMVSYLPERTYLNPSKRVSDIIAFFKDFYADFSPERANTMLEKFGIDPEAKIKSLSKGMREKVQIVLVMSRDAKLYLLDEPMGGVDPAARDYILRTISKNYKSHKVIKNMNVTFPGGKIIGILGPNGSGKSTLIKMLAGVLQPNTGQILIDGEPVGVKSKAMVSYLPERTYLNPSKRVSDIIAFFKDFYADFSPERANTMLEKFGIDPEAKIKSLSKGMREKVQIVLVMSRDAKLYLLDEPMGGVDPAARDYILRTIIENYNEDSTILITTHLISDIEKVLDDVVFIRDGGIFLNDSVDNIRTNYKKSVDELFREVFACC